MQTLDIVFIFCLPLFEHDRKKNVLAFVQFCLLILVSKGVCVCRFFLSLSLFFLAKNAYSQYIFIVVFETRHRFVPLPLSRSLIHSFSLARSNDKRMMHVSHVTLFYFYFPLNLYLLCEWHWNDCYCCITLNRVTLFFVFLLVCCVLRSKSDRKISYNNNNKRKDTWRKHSQSE